MARTMHAVVTRDGGPLDGPNSLVDATIDAPAAPEGHDLLVEVHATSVNPVDTKVRSGGKPSDGKVLGWDAAGVVQAVGPEVTLFAPGDEVFYAGDLTRAGSDAELQLVDERIVGHKPHTLDFAAAAALPLTSLTAYEALFDKLRLTADSSGTLLVLGSSGGVGSVLIQLAKQLTHVTVIAAASREDSTQWAVDLGADHVLNYHDDDFADQIVELVPGGVDDVFSAHSRGQIPFFIKVLRPFGQIVAIDDEPELDYYALKNKALTWHWEFMFARSMFHAPDLIRQHEILERIAELVDTGRVRTTLTRALQPFDAAQLREAHRVVESGHALGKIVVARS
ncbi:zinc-binding alcohol dehydrogenase family protein [Propionibacterium freudenreichii]|uniref:Zinc-type alcohol dehydrogenase-like protein n=1 Tax=Propionibacterium freudenreichii TaxID=1744 RepID=A0A509MJ23_9ACTN|nr:zinc-binding alcohol dehydrogenase family protein [Propionibacterium freudenreichii]SCQ81309.1 Alcohol dehydrogenase [Propionibacterium freudenreichii]